MTRENVVTTCTQGGLESDRLGNTHGMLVGPAKEYDVLLIIVSKEEYTEAMYGKLKDYSTDEGISRLQLLG